MSNVTQVELSEPEKQYGMCSVCFEMTTVGDVCCPLAGVLINGSYVHGGEGEEE